MKALWTGFYTMDKYTPCPYIISNTYGNKVIFNSVTQESGTRKSYNFLFPLQQYIHDIREKRLERSSYFFEFRCVYLYNVLEHLK